MAAPGIAEILVILTILGLLLGVPLLVVIIVLVVVKRDRARRQDDSSIPPSGKSPEEPR